MSLKLLKWLISLAIFSGFFFRGWLKDGLCILHAETCIKPKYFFNQKMWINQISLSSTINSILDFRLYIFDGDSHANKNIIVHIIKNATWIQKKINFRFQIFHWTKKHHHLGLLRRKIGVLELWQISIIAQKSTQKYVYEKVPQYKLAKIHLSHW